MTLTKAVIPAAGLGTRMLPAAKAVAKELLPVLDKPTIQYVVEEAAGGGITDVLLISSPAKRAVEQHFQPNPELEKRLVKSGKAGLLASIRELMAKVKMHAVDQLDQRGLGDAVRHGRAFVGGEPFLCMLGDAIFSGGAHTQPARQLIEAHHKLGTSVIGVEEVAADKVERYGIVGGREIRPGVWKLDTLVEKPTAASAPSRLAIAARYVLTPGIFDCLDATPPGAGGEIQLTDAIRMLMSRGETVHAVVLKNRRHDIGSPLDWLKTNLVFASRDVKLWEQIAPLARELLAHAPPTTPKTPAPRG
ncbi:MAG: UTP--glucose-phosphate uridylyltransferase [Phycisphaerales bacterium]|jgi:UTP--glucose-1-phosphate uridylyltransferase|nr:UTP--glucose-phosphate uridylyltransferase [Phycisphaerales bacterium]